MGHGDSTAVLLQQGQGVLEAMFVFLDLPSRPPYISSFEKKPHPSCKTILAVPLSSINQQAM